MNLRTPDTIEDACKYLQELIKLIGKQIEQDGIFGEVHLETDDDWSYDTVVLLKIGMPNGGIYDTGYMITPIMETRAQGIRQRQGDYVRYYVQHEVHVPGGFHEPDSSDVVDDHLTDRPIDAATKAIFLTMQNELDHMFTSMAEEDMANEHEEYCREMAGGLDHSEV
jgi:hypothetical protein